MSDAVIFAENDDFVSIGDFERSLSWGAEIEFEWKGVLYGVIRYGTDHKITIYQCGHPETEKVCETAEEAQTICIIFCGGRQRPPHFSGVSPVPYAYSVLNAQRRGSGT